MQLGEDGARGDGVERNEGLEIKSRPAESHLRKREERRGGGRTVGGIKEGDEEEGNKSVAGRKEEKGREKNRSWVIFPYG